jgi:type IV pilus assembly protein PilA
VARSLSVPNIPRKQELSATLIGTAMVGLPMIMMLGVGAAIAIPAYLRFIRRSKTTEATVNISAIAKGATGWYNDQHLDKAGKPMPRQFPCAGKGWVCAPKAMPCASGQALYTPHPAQWQDACWTQLQFSLNKPHHYRYCFKSEGEGVNARFDIKVQGDLDCNGKYSTYLMIVRVDHKTGEVERSNLMRLDPLE